MSKNFLFSGTPVEQGSMGTAASGRDAASWAALPRLRRPERDQVRMERVCLNDRVPAEHRVRLVWQVVELLDLRGFYQAIAARGSEPGRAATDPKLLVALWLYAAVDNGSARHLARLCQEHDAYRWLCGGVSINHHTLSDFRVGHEAGLDDLLTQVLVGLVDQGLVTVERISQDSLRTRTAAGKSSFRRRKTLETLLEKVQRHVEQLKLKAQDADDVRSPRQQAAQALAAREQLERVTAALAVLPELEAIKHNQTGKSSRQQEARASTTDAAARRMKLGDGAVHPAYNIQFATDCHSRVVVGVAVTNAGTDHQQSKSVREQVQERTGCKVAEHLMDGGYVKKDLIDDAEQSGVAIYAPLPVGNDGKPCVQGKNDKPGVKAWRARMQTEEAKHI